MRLLKHHLAGLFLAATVVLTACSKEDIQPKDLTHQDQLPATVATGWATMTLTTIREGFKNSPTYSSRTLGYMGLCMYECVVNADSTMRSLDGQLNGLPALPKADPGLTYDWSVALNAGQETLLKLLYPLNENISQVTSDKISNYSRTVGNQQAAGVDVDVVNRSVAFGQAIANAIYAWSVTDGGLNAFKKHFDPTYPMPTGPGYWTPPIAGQTVSPYPLHPHWGENRTFLAVNSTLPIPQLATYSQDPTSQCYQYYHDVYVKSQNLTLPEKEIAAWWTDDPTETYSPPGHSYNLATIAVQTANPRLVKAAQTYARVGMATADAFITCWKTKYTYFNERPSTFIRSCISSIWNSYWPEPPFPAFPSGHSTQGSAAAEVLTAIYGDNFAFTDNTHEGAHRFSAELQFKARHFTSFRQAAEESGYSRILGGIHTWQDNNVGLAEGKKIGQNINSLHWTK